MATDSKKTNNTSKPQNPVIDQPKKDLDPTREQRLRIAREAQQRSQELQQKLANEKRRKAQRDAKASSVTAAGILIGADEPPVPQPNIITSGNKAKPADQQNIEAAKQARAELQETAELKEAGYTPRVRTTPGEPVLVGAPPSPQKLGPILRSDAPVQGPTAVAIPNYVRKQISPDRVRMGKLAHIRKRQLARLNAAGKITQPVNAVKTGTKAGIKKLLKKAIGKLGAKAAAYLAAAATGVGTVVAGIGIATDIVNFLRKQKEAFLAIFSWIQIKIAAFINYITSIGGLVGGGAGMLVAGPLGAIPGAIIGATVQSKIADALGFGAHENTAIAKEVTQTVVQGTPKVVTNPVTSNLVVTRTGGALDIFTGHQPLTTTVSLSTINVPIFVGLGTTVAMTAIVAATIMVAFTVPNPQGTEAIYTTLATNPQYDGDGQPVPDPIALPPASADLATRIETAAAVACVPSDLVAAIMQTESGSYNWSDEQVNRFSENGWWEDAGPNNENCYYGHFYEGACREGYCYDTCTQTGICGGQGAYANNHPPGGDCTGETCWSRPTEQQCPANGTTECTYYDVYGPTQFLRTTFYGGDCRVRDGVIAGTQTAADGCFDGRAAVIMNASPGRTEFPNRCDLDDAVISTALKIQADAGAQNSCPDASFWTVDRICQAAKSYCGSCGLVQDPSHPLWDESNPCFALYEEPSASAGACGGPNSEGYCDKVAKLYFGTGQ